MKNVSFSWSWPNTRDIILKQNTLLEKDKHYAHACDIENVQSGSEEHYNTIVLLVIFKLIRIHKFSTFLMKLFRHLSITATQ